MQRQSVHKRFTGNMQQLLNSVCISYALPSTSDSNMPIDSAINNFNKRPECLYT